MRGSPRQCKVQSKKPNLVRSLLKAFSVLGLPTMVGRFWASGRLIGTPHRSGFLIFAVSDRAKVEALGAADPFAVKGLIEKLTITEWDPLFGALAPESSGHLPGLTAPLPTEV